MNFYNVELFTLSHCRYCKEVKEILTQDGVSYTEKQLDDMAMIFEIGDSITMNQFNVLDGFYGRFVNAYNYENVDGAMSHLADSLLNKSDDEFVSIIRENSDVNQVIKDIDIYLSDNPNLINIYNKFYNSEVVVFQNQTEFGKLIEGGKVSASVPQILINGEIFPHESSDGDFSTLYELKKCIDAYGDSDACFFEFANNRDEFDIETIEINPIELLTL